MFAAVVVDQRPLGRSGVGHADWHDDIDHMNPLVDDPSLRGQARRFIPPWSEVICVVTASDGSFGVGLTGLGEAVVPVINDYLGPMVVGEPVDDPKRLWAMMSGAVGAYLGRGAIAGYALSAVDLALWDLWGRLQQEPVWRLIGGDRGRPAIDCYATGLSLDDHLARGFDAFKLVCPWGPDRDDALRRLARLVEEARATVGADRALMLDCWMVNDPDDAIAIAEVVAAYDLQWIEDYVRPDDALAYRRVRDATDHRLASGERWYGVESFELALADGWVDVVQPDALWVGGATPTVAVAELVDGTDVELALHCGANDAYGQHLAYGLAANRWAELYVGAEPGASLMDSYRATPGMALPVNGAIRPTDAPGFGIELSPADIERVIGSP